MIDARLKALGLVKCDLYPSIEACKIVGISDSAKNAGRRLRGLGLKPVRPFPSLRANMWRHDDLSTLLSIRPNLKAKRKDTLAVRVSRLEERIANLENPHPPMAELTTGLCAPSNNDGLFLSQHVAGSDKQKPRSNGRI